MALWAKTSHYKKEIIIIATVESKWQELKELVVNLADDVMKNAGGNAAAGTRARKGRRSLKQQAADLVKLTLGKEVS